MTIDKDNIGFLGPVGTFTEEAAKIYNTNKNTLIPYETIFDTIKAVEKSHICKAVVPIENSVEGSVAVTLDLLVESDVLIELEIDLPIIHNLLAPKGTSLQDITDVISHPQAIAQCQSFLRNTWPKINTHKANSTSDAAKIIATNQKKSYAAIGHVNAAQVYNLEIIKPAINDYKENVTRFIVIGKEPTQKTKHDKTSIVLSLLKDQPGGLYKILGEFAARNINLAKIESRPTKKTMGEYLFFIDLIGHSSDNLITEALSSVQKFASFFKVLGSYSKKL